MKNIGYIVGILILVWLGYWVFTSYSGTEDQNSRDGDEISGVVTNINLEQMTFDGPSLVTIAIDGGGIAVIAVPSMGRPLCVAFENVAEPSHIESGDHVRVVGDINEEGQIVPCERAEHELIVERTVEGGEVGVSFAYRVGPDGYRVNEIEAGTHDDPSFIKAYILMLESDYLELQSATAAREGPPTMNVVVYKNADNQDAKVWVDAHKSLSNIGLISGEADSDQVLAGANAVRYMVDGLYRTDTVVAASSGYIYVISGAYFEEDSTIRRDFDDFLSSIEFISVEADE